MSARDELFIPASETAEQALIGAVLCWPRVFVSLADTGLKSADFYSPAHQAIWEAMGALTARREPIDVITVFEALRDADAHEAVGGLPYLTSLQNGQYTETSARRYAKLVREKAQDRAILDAADRIADLARAAGDPDEKLDAAQAILGEMKPQGAGGAPRALAEHIAERVAHWQALAEGTVVPGIPTGLPHLDQALGGGLKRGAVLVIGARPSVGKTSLATAITLAGAHAGYVGLFLSQEMVAGELVDRITSSLAGVPLDGVVTGALNGEQEARRAAAMDEASRLRLVIDETAALSLLAIRSKARQVQQQQGRLDLIVLDYLQLAKDDGKAQHRHHQIEQLSRGMKALAKELHCAVIVLSQINRMSTQRADGEPTLADLKESGAIEEDADVVLLLHPRDKLPDGRLLVVGIVAKNRQGRRGRLALAFDGPTQRWEQTHADVSPRRSNP